MARTGSGTLLCRRNIKLDSFLKRNTERAEYERIRIHEPSVVVSESVHRVYMHVVLSDERVYLTEYLPRTLTAAVGFGRVRDIELVNDLPDFLSGKDRECCQHIRIIYVTNKPAAKGLEWFRRDERSTLPPVAPAARRNSHCPLISHPLEGKRVLCSEKACFCSSSVSSRSRVEWRNEDAHVMKPARSASCPDPETLGLQMVPHPPSQPPTSSPASPPSPSEGGCFYTSLFLQILIQVPRRISSVLSRLLRRDCVSSREEREAELHLYSVSPTSTLYLHLQSSWNSFIIRSTLLLDPHYRRKCNVSSEPSPGKQRLAISQERTAHLFGQLSSELLQDGISVESLYLLLQELRTAAHRNITLRRLFWRSSEVCVFLVQTLEETLHGDHNASGVYTTDQLLLSTVIVQTLAIMFRETEVEAARLNLLSAEKGAVASRMLLALICDPRLQTQSRGPETDSELQAFLSEYLDAACSLLFELLLSRHETSRCFSVDNLLSVGWILRVLQPHPHLLPFIDHQAQELVLVLSELQDSDLSPVQAVLLFQRCRFLLACLQYNSQLAQHLRSHFREEFRYSVKPSSVKENLPPQYLISLPTLRLVEQILTLIASR
uniref:Si:ch211-258f14.2 n=1 Tax=Echeneis naucrates TaxID=173247 RepID=A0A665UEX2_ECHNA